MRLAIALLAMVAVTLSAAPQAGAESPYPPPTRDGRERIQRTGVCPTGFVGKGRFCEELHRDTPPAFAVIPGKACPTGTFRSGDACEQFR